MSDTPEPIPQSILETLFRALVWDKANTRDDINVAWKYLEDRNPWEEMGR